MTIAITMLDATEVDAAQDAIQRVYAAAFAPPPYEKDAAILAQFRPVLERHMRRRGFRFAAAREDGRLVGFCYGYTGRPGQWWHDLVSAGLTPPLRHEWLADSLEFVELAVAPAWQGRGIGGQLHDRLLAGAPQQTAVLSTLEQETAGQRLYRRRGWVTLIAPFLFPGNEQPYRIMGKRLREARPR